jgi:cell shape-determining protein MreC
VSGNCSAGNFIQTVNSDGTVVCGTLTTLPDTRPVFSRSTLDSAGNVGQYTSVTIGSDGLGLISYYDATNSDLKAAHCNNTACSSAAVATLDSAGDVGFATSVTIGSDGLGLISYFVNINFDLKVAHCNNTVCSSAAVSTLDSAGIVGEYTSVTIGTDGLGLISYYDQTNGDLRVAHCSNIFGLPFVRPR